MRHSPLSTVRVAGPARRKRCRALGLLAALLGIAVATAGCSRPSAQRLNDDGNRAFNRGEYAQALEDYRKAQVERPDQPAFNYNAGNALHQQGEYPRAISESLRATQGKGTDVRARAYYSIGADYYREGKLKEALDAYKNALRLDPNDLDTKFNVEVIQRRLDKEAEERRQIEQQAGQQQNQPNQGEQQQGQQPNQAQQQGGRRFPEQPPQQGQQPGQNQPGQQDQNGQPGPQQNAQSGQQNAQASVMQPGSQAAGATAPGAAGTPGPSLREQQAQLGQDLRNAIEAYNKQPSIEEALRILDILAEQERIAQAEQGNRSDPRGRDK